ncbi:MAG: electron transfer flavoprotein subunit beta/FixA family protein [Humibacter sp.]
MRIVVLVKQVPDTYGDRKTDLATGLVDRAGSESVADEIGERAVEAALVIQKTVPETVITVMTMGPESAIDALRKGLALGADDAVHIVDDGLLGADLTLTAEVLAAAIRRQEFDLVLTGNISTDGAGGVLAAMLAEHLGLAQVTNLSSITVGDGAVTGTRVIDGGTAEVTAVLPAVASITEAMPDPRLPSFKGIMAAKKKPVTTITAAELNADLLGEQAARAIVLSASTRPPRSAGIKIVDEGDGGAKLAEWLVAQKLA